MIPLQTYDSLWSTPLWSLLDFPLALDGPDVQALC